MAALLAEARPVVAPEARQEEPPEELPEERPEGPPVGWLEAPPGAWQVGRQAERQEGLEEGHLGARRCRVRARGKCATR